jgi:hypothetical protein
MTLNKVLHDSHWIILALHCTLNPFKE